MNDARHALLSPDLRALLQRHAVAVKVTLDELVAAGLARPASDAARAGAAAVRAERADAFRGLAAWPLPCPVGCGRDVPAPEPSSCSRSKPSTPLGCSDCATPLCVECRRAGEGRCPKCAAVYEEKRAAARETGASLGGGVS